METIVVSVHDTNKLILLLAYYDIMECSRLYVKAGTSKASNYFPVHEIRFNQDEATKIIFEAVIEAPIRNECLL